MLIVSGKHLNIVPDLTQHALSIDEAWCLDKGVHVNPSKTNSIIFTKKRSLVGLSVITLFGNELIRSDFEKHFVVILDGKLCWKKHLDYKLQKAIAIFWQCRRTFGKSWGLTPKMLYFWFININHFAIVILCIYCMVAGCYFIGFTKKTK